MLNVFEIPPKEIKFVETSNKDQIYGKSSIFSSQMYSSMPNIFKKKNRKKKPTDSLK